MTSSPFLLPVQRYGYIATPVAFRIRHSQVKWVVMTVVCMFLAAFLHRYTDANVTLGNGRGCPASCAILGIDHANVNIRHAHRKRLWCANSFRKLWGYWTKFTEYKFGVEGSTLGVIVTGRSVFWFSLLFSDSAVHGLGWALLTQNNGQPPPANFWTPSLV